MPGHSFVDALRLDEFHEAELRGFVAVFVLRASLHDDTWPRLQHRAADQRAVVGEDLRHSQLDSDDPVDRHFLRFLLASYLPAISRRLSVFSRPDDFQFWLQN